MPDFSNRRGLDSFESPPVKPTTADWPNTLLGIKGTTEEKKQTLSEKLDDRLEKLERKGKIGYQTVTVIIAPVQLYRAIKGLPGTLKTISGCRGKWYRAHKFDWNVGHRGWWMYCAECGKAVGDDKSRNL